MNSKQIGKVLTSKFVGTGPSSYKKKNLPGRGLTEVEKHWYIWLLLAEKPSPIARTRGVLLPAQNTELFEGLYFKIILSYRFYFVQYYCIFEKGFPRGTHMRAYRRNDLWKAEISTSDYMSNNSLFTLLVYSLKMFTLE